MTRYCEFKRRYDSDLGKYVRKHIYDGTIYGKGITTSGILKAVGKKLFGKTADKIAANSEYAGKKAGNKIVNLLRKNRTAAPSLLRESVREPEVLTQQDVNGRVNQILSGGKLRRR